MQKEEVLSLARLLGYYEAYGGFEKLEENQRAMETLEETQIISIARKYLKPENLSVLEFINEEISTVTPIEFLRQMKTGFSASEAALPPPILTERKPLKEASFPSSPFLQKGKITYILHADRSPEPLPHEELRKATMDTQQRPGLTMDST